MLREVAHQHVATRPRDACPAHLVGRELRGQSVEHPSQFAELLEHLRVARRVGPTPDDLVGTVLAVDARSPEELPALGQRVADRVLQVRGVVSGQFVGVAIDRQYYRLAVAPYRNVTLVTREELDQERLHSVSCVDTSLPREYNSTGERKYPGLSWKCWFFRPR